jgi:hypothetical protein
MSRSQILGQSLPVTNQGARGLEELVKELILQLQYKESASQTVKSGGIPSRVFDWLKCKPRTLYHLRSWVQSVDDTPLLFQNISTDWAPQRRGITKYLTGGLSSVSIKEPTYKSDKMHEIITPEALKFLSTFDFKLNDDFTFTSDKITLDSGEVSEESALLVHQRRLLNSLNDSVSTLMYCNLIFD